MRFKFLAIALLPYLTGCMSQILSDTEWAKGWIGEPANRIIRLVESPASYAERIGWKDRRYTLNNGNWVYVVPSRPDCLVHFEVNHEGVIEKYTLVGDGCEE